jgi:hypothetical protein
MTTVQPTAARMAAVTLAGSPYRTCGEFLVDHVRALGVGNKEPDPAAQLRIAQARLYESRVVADQKTTDTTGLIPVPVVGTVISLIDANRPLVMSLGPRTMDGIPGAQFTRPKITQHTLAGVQTGGDKTQLPSQKMIISPVTFSKATYGGTVDISRQDMDWTSPSAWDALIADLARVYATTIETAAAAAFAAAATSTVPMGGTVFAPGSLPDWTTALYTAAMHSYQATYRLPDRIWCSLDVWAALGSMIDSARLVIPPDRTSEMGAPGTSSLASFAGDLLGVPRIVVPTFPSGTVIVGHSSCYEIYEEIIGLVSVVEPSILGVQVAYGGYVAFGAVAAAGLVKLTGLPALPT